MTAVQLARLAGHATLFTALGDDELGHRAADELRRLGLDVRAVFREGQQQRGSSSTLTPRVNESCTCNWRPDGAARRRSLAWPDFDFDAVYFTAGHVGAALAARRAGSSTATARALATLREADVSLDSLVRRLTSTPGEPSPRPTRRPHPSSSSRPSAAPVVDGRHATGARGEYDAVESPGPVLDTYGCGDAFAGGLTAGPRAGLDVVAALDLAARCGAWVASLDGPYGR